jgi:hypothetical protein
VTHIDDGPAIEAIIAEGLRRSGFARVWIYEELQRKAAAFHHP